MKILHRGKTKEFKDNWFWRCPKCHTIGYHETEDGYTCSYSSGEMGFSCPICGSEIKNNKYINRIIAWILWIWYEYKKQK